MGRCSRAPYAAIVISLVLIARAAALPAAPPAPSPGPAPPGGRDQTTVRLEVQPQEVPIGLFYGGTTIQVTAELPAGLPCAVLLEGQHEELTLKRKGKVWGILWMNVSEVEFAEVPAVYLLRASAPLDGLASAEQLAAAGLGYAALAHRAGGSPADFQELVKMKEKEKFFSIDPSAITFAPVEPASVRLSASLPLTARIPAGQYTITLFGFDGGRIQRLSEATVRLEQAGLARTLHSLAMEHGLLYGCTAVLIAMLAGFGTGLIFGKGASKGH
jgi:uncharacterized protein (TIGR02186 family)